MEKTQVLSVLEEIRDELRSIRSLLEPKLKFDEGKPEQLVIFKDEGLLKPREGFSRIAEGALAGIENLVIASRSPGKKTSVDGPIIQALIASYIDSWRARYGTTARPGINRAIGIFRQLLKERKPEEIRELIQVYCQMKDPWFQTRCHDIATFQANIDKVALALDKGREKPVGTDRDWREIDAERNRNDP